MNIIEKKIHLKHLNRDATLYLGIPKNTVTHILYVHDAQNIFGDQNATYGMGWNIHKVLKNGDSSCLGGWGELCRWL